MLRHRYICTGFVTHSSNYETESMINRTSEKDALLDNMNSFIYYSNKIMHQRESKYHGYHRKCIQAGR
ncbi:hypothetical protein MNV_140011 [Candidatus Methanoperedens nitroreducens]|uniref:Uncharacterized protein n=1 Tax=Candidatus Methanoperedens nitratireducens TaxID=1392998 RepID=A0A284VKQ7_9EURY|nr:hypothetical protein MNV_140011 [Candidatus Methanoperedens nitroreducens]